MVIGNERMMPDSPPPPPSIFRISLRPASHIVIAAVALALGACGGDSVEKVRDAALAGEDAALERVAAVEAERNAARARAEAAEAALADAQEALRLASEALSDGGDGDARQELGRQLRDTTERLSNVRTELGSPADDAGRETVRALELTEAALSATERALGLAARVGAGALLAASAHTLLDEALGAVDDAQAQLVVAAEAVDDAESAAGRALQAARGALTSAQVSLLPKIRQELEMAEAGRNAARSDAEQQRTRADAAERERDAARSEAEQQRTRADAAERERDAARSEAEQQRDAARSEAEQQRTRADAAERERDAARGETEEQRERADEAEGERDELTRTHVSPPLFQSTAGPRDLGATITITRTARTVPDTATDPDTWVANPDALEIATDAVPYAAGRTLVSRAGNEEFPMREITFRGDIRQGSQRGLTGAAADNDGRYPIIQGPGNTLGNANDHTKTAVISSIRLSEDGELTLKAGGSGVVFNEFQYDIRGTEADGPDGIPGEGSATSATTATAYHVAMFRRAGETPPSVGDTLTQDQADKLTGWAADNCSGVTFPCWDGNMRDLTINFGKPSPDPDGEAGYHWASKIPSSDGQPKPEVAEAMHRWAKPKVENFVDADRGAGEYRGEYRLWLSNYAGLDTGATDAETDDSHRFLQYAAYGLFTFTDYLTSNVRPARMQGFHFGYDAFADADGMRTTELGTPITATFKGRASAMVMEPHSDRSQVERLIRVRGDVTLNAVIGGANTITGSISNFEQPAGRAWGPYAPLTDSVLLTNGTISADGSYEGDTTVDSGASHLWDPGAFGGNLYGNKGGPDLETAGWWYLTPRGYTAPPGSLTGADARDYPGRPDFRYSGAFGSFGAECTTGCGNN